LSINNNNNQNNNTPGLRKNRIWTLLILSAATLMLLLTSTLLSLSNPLLLQPVQAQTNLSFRTPIPANGTYYTGEAASITFDAQGETFINSVRLEANGTYQITASSSGQVLSSGSISRVQGCCLSNPSNGDKITIITGDNTEISTSCSTSNQNNIGVQAGELSENFQGPVECSSSQGGDTTTTHATQPSSSSMTGTTSTQDSDGDGIPDSSDKRTHNSNQRCYKESK
jgi:hypothetical protein